MEQALQQPPQESSPESLSLRPPSFRKRYSEESIGRRRKKRVKKGKDEKIPVLPAASLEGVATCEPPPLVEDPSLPPAAAGPEAVQDASLPSLVESTVDARLPSPTADPLPMVDAPLPSSIADPPTVDAPLPSSTADPPTVDAALPSSTPQLIESDDELEVYVVQLRAAPVEVKGP